MTWTCSSCEHQNLGRHQTCQQCGDPKDAGERYEMPADPARAASVTDAALLRMAEAGPNWQCAYCGSHQRALDGSCGQCGASAKEGKLLVPPRRLRGKVSWFRKHRLALGIVGTLLAVIIGVYAWMHRTRTFDAKVTDAEWTQTILVEKYQVWAREGWRDSQPAQAFDVVSKGQQIHHYEQVLDHYETEHYTEQVSCGEDCYDEPESCHEVCDDNGNGFASCHTECSGGGRRCTTRYCTESRSREVPKYRDEPRYAEAIAYHVWDWGVDRTVEATGHGVTGLRWPVEEAHLAEQLGPEEQEREQRVARYTVTLAYDGTSTLRFEVDLDDFARFPPGSRHQLRMKRGEPTTVDGEKVSPL